MFRLASLRIASARVLATRSLAVRKTAVPSIAFRWYSDSSGLTRKDIESRIFQLLQDFDKVNQDKLSPVADFSKDLGLDSLDTVEVVMAIEEEFSVEIPDDEADKITTVKGAIDYISARDDAH
ncbi:mitochondrial acyl carrier protein [Coemansia sp. RSA 2050]|nr:mitochondrial acyl carrier protein [Coemansia sp. RSA 2050]KAJ2730896.1 mitochondrial acyl carrier protein [Coemansia sp. BCRC 34962]